MELQPADRRAYALSGKATLTLEGRSSRFTYRIEKTERAQVASHWVYVLNGPNNETDFKFLGGIETKHVHGQSASVFYHSGKSRIGVEAPSAKAFEWFWRNIESDKVRVYHSGQCGRCGRTLTTPESIRTGLGPVCAERG